MYKYCIVPKCESNTTNTPEKIFLWVPVDPERRKKWFQLARRDHKSIRVTSACFMCEDHFDVKNDILNYMKFKMGFSQKILVRDGALPSKFVCQKSCQINHSGVIPWGPFEKRQHRLDVVSQCLQECSTETEQEKVSQCIQEISIEPEEIQLTEETCQPKEIDLLKTQGNETTIDTPENIGKNLCDQMVDKWCVVPKCTNSTIKCPQKLFLSVPMRTEKRKLWLKLARRNPNSILASKNVYMCEDHFDMEKDSINYLQYKMGFSHKILLTAEAVPTKFHCQKKRKRQLSDSSREVFLKRQRINILVTECQQNQSTTMDVERLQNDDNKLQEIIEPRAANSKEKNVEFEDEVDIKEEFEDGLDIKEEFEDEVDIKEELIDIDDDDTYLMLAEDSVADSEAIGDTDTTYPIKTEELQEDGLRSCLEKSENQTNTTKQTLIRDVEADDIELSNETSKGIPEDPDILFLYSLLPDIKEMNKDQKRRFKIGVLQLTNDILQEK